LSGEASCRDTRFTPRASDSRAGSSTSMTSEIPRAPRQGCRLHALLRRCVVSSDRFRASGWDEREGQTGFRAPASRGRAASVARARVARSITRAESSMSWV
jgi:hypothetical protein